MALPYIAIFMRGANRGVAVMAGSAGGMNPAPTNKFYVSGNRDGRGHAL